MFLKMSGLEATSLLAITRFDVMPSFLQTSISAIANLLVSVIISLKEFALFCALYGYFALNIFLCGRDAFVTKHLRCASHVVVAQ